MSDFFNHISGRAASGDTEAMNRVAICHILGVYGFEKNYGVAVEWIKKAAKLKDVTAFNNLDCIYTFGILGFEKDLIKSKYWFDCAVKFENADYLRALQCLVAGKEKEATDYVELAVNKGQCVAAMLMLSKTYDEDEEGALYLLRCAANRGSLRAVVARVGVSSLQIEEKDACGGCGKWAMNICSGCRVRKYCSLQCQKQAWHNHKSDCYSSIFRID
jgi:TPR repeat protein